MIEFNCEGPPELSGRARSAGRVERCAVEKGIRGQTYGHKLLQLLPLHAGSELALLVCVEAVAIVFVSLGIDQQN